MTMTSVSPRRTTARPTGTTPVDRERPQLRVVPRRAPRSTTRGRVLIGALLLFVLPLGVVAFHVHLVKSQQRIDHLNTQADESQAQYDRLRVEVDCLSSPTRVVSVASTLGLVQPAEATWLTPVSIIRDDGLQESSPVDQNPSSYNTVKPYLKDTR